jgi:SPFH domain / Band 7 family
MILGAPENHNLSAYSVCFSGHLYCIPFIHSLEQYDMSNPFQQFLRRLYSAIPSGGGVAMTAVTSLGLAAYGLSNSIITIQPGHQGVVYNRLGGLQEKPILKDGINLVIPWFQRVIIYDVRTRPQLINTQSGSKGNRNILSFVINNQSLILYFIFRSSNGKL